MNNKNDKETTPEKKYVAFHKERQEPIDCFTRHEIDNKLKAIQAGFDKKLKATIKEIEESQVDEIKEVKAEFNGILKKISDRFQEYYTQEKINQFAKDLKSRYNTLDRFCDLLEKQHVKLEELVLEYLNVTDIGELVGDKFILNEKKKRFWKK